MRLRTAEPHELDAITRLINVAFKVERFFIERDRISATEVYEFAEKGQFLVAEDVDTIVGCVYIEKRADSAYLGLLSVDPSRQRGGLGSELMQYAEDFCRDLGCRAVDLRIVNVRAELPAFYQRRGYVETGTSPVPARQAGQAALSLHRNDKVTGSPRRGFSINSRRSPPSQLRTVTACPSPTLPELSTS